MRLIDADHLLNEIEALKKSPWFNNGSDSFDPLVRGRHLAINETVGMVVDLCIKQEPTVEPKRGRWVEDDHILVCSECEGVAMQRVYYSLTHNATDIPMVKTPYCPWCGAKMERSENDG